MASFLHQPVAKRVPKLTFYFWVINVLTTGMEETTSGEPERVIWERDQSASPSGS